MPVEVHRHLDPDGKLVGYTEVTRESPWNDEMRDHAEALYEAKRNLICPKCGNLRSVCSDPNVPWYPQRSTCYATAVEEATRRAWHDKLDGKHYDRTPQPRDGTHVWASRQDLTPDDDFI